MSCPLNQVPWSSFVNGGNALYSRLTRWESCCRTGLPEKTGLSGGLGN